MHCRSANRWCSSAVVAVLALATVGDACAQGGASPPLLPADPARPIHVGLHAGPIFAMHQDARLASTALHGVERLDAAGVGYGGDLSVEIPIGPRSSLVPMLGFASWSASGLTAGVPVVARLKERGVEGPERRFDSTIMADVAIDLDYRLVRTGILFRFDLTERDARTTVSASVGPGCGVVIGSLQQESLEMEREIGVVFANDEAYPTSNNGYLLHTRFHEIDRRAFVRMSAIAGLAVARQFGERLRFGGQLLADIPLTSVVEGSGWRALAIALALTAEWRL